jgi:class 3 adenylate cyclase
MSAPKSTPPEAQLWALIEERKRPGADAVRIDLRIWETAQNNQDSVRFPAKAIECAIDMNRRSREVNHGRAPEDQVLLCVGIGYGRVPRVGDHDVFGQEVNAASKLGEDIAKAGEILVTEAVRLAASELPGVRYEPIASTVAGSATNHRVVY